MSNVRKMMGVLVTCFTTLSFFALMSTSTEIVTRTTKTVDQTLVSGSTGVDVVDACVQKLNTIKSLSNDFGLIKRIAYVESEFGTLTGVGNNAGGIWRITQSIQQRITESSSSLQLSNITAEALQQFGADIADMTNPDFSIPLRSALAARLFMELLGTPTIPATLSDQATWWATHYNPSQSASQFQTRVSTFESTPVCQVQKMDIWFLIDGSGSIGRSNFETTLQFVANLSAEFPISLNGVRAGFSVYESSHTFYSRFNEHTSNSNFSQLVLSTPYTGGGTRTGAAIDDVVANGFNESSGLRPLSEGAPRVLIVLTDGQSSDSVLEPAENARNNGIRVFGVGVGSGVDESEINEIADDPDSVHAFNLQDFSQLLSVLKQSLSESACKVSAPIPDNTTVEIDIPAGETRYLTVQLLVNGSIELSYVITSNGGGVIYISDTSENPNSALFEISFRITQGNNVITINDGDTNSGLVLVGSPRRARRSISTQNMFLAIEADDTSPLRGTFKATGSPTKAVLSSATIYTPKITVFGFIFATLLGYIVTALGIE